MAGTFVDDLPLALEMGEGVTAISKLVLQNFKKFDALELDFHAATNILVGDNEAGKSTVLLALDLILGASRGRVETVGVESLLCKGSRRRLSGRRPQARASSSAVC